MKKVILITGGSDGLGYVIAKRLSRNNEVVICSPTKDKLETTARELGCDYELCDVSDNNSINKAVESIIGKYGRLDCLINNAGVWIQDELDTNNSDDIKKVMEVNALGVILCSRAVISQMKSQKNGLIVNIISQAGFYGKADRSVYTASKHAVTGFTKSLIGELAPYGIKVTGVYPGKMKTTMFQKMGIKKEMKNGLELDEVAKTIEFIISMGGNTVFPEIGIKHIDN